MQPNAIIYGIIVVLLIIGLIFYSIIWAFTHKPRDPGVFAQARTLRRNIGAALFFGIGLTIYSQARSGPSDDWQYGGPLLAFSSAILYGYATKIEKAARLQEHKLSKKTEDEN